MRFHSTVLFVKDIQLSKEFYTRVLDLKIEQDFGKNIVLEGGISLWQVQKEHIISKQLKTGGCDNRFELYFETEDIEMIGQKLQAEGMEFLHGIHEEPWGQRTLRFFDPDRHLIEIGESMEFLVSNMKMQGLSIQQISDKSGISMETVESMLFLSK